MYKCKHFKLYELLPPTSYKSEADGWELLDIKLLKTVDWIRELLKVPLTINTWHNGGNRIDSGYRDSASKVGSTTSQHRLGRAVDIISSKMSAEQMRQEIIANKAYLPYNIRIESQVNWLHVDVKKQNYADKIYLFKP